MPCLIIYRKWISTVIFSKQRIKANRKEKRMDLVCGFHSRCTRSHERNRNALLLKCFIDEKTYLHHFPELMTKCVQRLRCDSWESCHKKLPAHSFFSLVRWLLKLLWDTDAFWDHTSSLPCRCLQVSMKFALFLVPNDVNCEKTAVSSQTLTAEENIISISFWKPKHAEL